MNTPWQFKGDKETKNHLINWWKIFPGWISGIVQLREWMRKPFCENYEGEDGRHSIVSLPSPAGRIFTLWSEKTKVIITIIINIIIITIIKTLSSFSHCGQRPKYSHWASDHWNIIMVNYNCNIQCALTYSQYPLLWLQHLMYPWIFPMAITQNQPDPLLPCSVCSTHHCKTPCLHL